jgi:primosomal replication protein N''
VTQVRYCPNCGTERELDEIYCEGTIDGVECGWNLATVPIRPRGAGAPPPPQSPPPPPGTAGPPAEPQPPRQVSGAATCPNGHPVDAGDLLCPTCGAFVDEAPPAGPETPSVIDGWELGRGLASTSRVRERFVAVHAESGRQAVLTLYAEGSEPDPAVYEVLRTLPRDHVPEILVTGRWHDRAYEVAEELTGGTLADLGAALDDPETLARIVTEVGRALHAFAEVGLRHRDLRPGALLVRGREPLDLVVTSFGSARLSDFDLDLVSPLEVSRYTAPEAALGGVAAASDWWSLGMILLEQATRGACFEGVNEQAFLIHVLTHGAPVPDDLDARLRLLLCGLLARERRERWGWSEVERWLAGETLPTPPSSLGPGKAPASGPAITLGGRAYTSAGAFTLAAADAANWAEARDLLLRGALATWADEAGVDAQTRAALRHIVGRHDLAEDARLSLALRFLNPAMPLAWAGEIVTPGWLLDYPELGYALVTGPAPDLLDAVGAEPWLSRLKTRAATVRERARHLEIDLVEEELRVHLLSTSRARLGALWEERRTILADTDHPGLLALMDRRQLSEEDLIILLSAAPGQFRTPGTILDEAGAEAASRGFAFDPTQAAQALRRSRREVYLDVDRRTEGMARCGIDWIDALVDRFRLERRLPLSRALLVLAVPPERWKAPPGQEYVSTLLDFFARRVVAAVQRGPLARMTIGKTTARVDLAELGTDVKPAAAILDRLLERGDRALEVDPAAFGRGDTLERRSRALESHANLYRRDTGIDGLYLGFPVLQVRDGRTARPRIMPVLLWPVTLRHEVGARGRVVMGFDSKRSDVRLNPAFETILGTDVARKWAETRDQVLGGTLTARSVMEGFGMLAPPREHALVPLPGRDTRADRPQELRCAAVLFHLAYTGQAVAEDLRALRARPPRATALETALRVAEPPPREPLVLPPERDRYFTAPSDPSQERAVFEARCPPGIVVEGPPGTGKSQTIVNMVADAISRKKTLLVVCQKLAALEVVYKRLVAEGLEHRIVLVHDETRDRQNVIRAVREQEEALRDTSEGFAAWRQRREQAAARIEALEGELDRHHALLHRPDQATGLSYRALVGEIIRVEGRHPAPVDAPALRAVLGPLSPADVAGLEETCGPLAPYWLPARYEDSPMSVLLPFDADAATAAALRAALDGLAAAEAERMNVLQATAGALETNDPARVAEWLREHAPAFAALADDERERLARWLPLLPVPSDTARADALLAELAEVDEGLAATRATEAATRIHHVLADTADAELGEWTALARELSAPSGPFAWLSLARWAKRRRLAALFRAREVVDAAGDLRAFVQAAEGEARRRPWRRRLRAAWAELAPDAASVDHWSYTRQAEFARTLAAQLSAARELALRLRHAPVREQARAALERGRAQVWADFVARAERGLARAAARDASRRALAALEPWLDPAWLAERSAAIDTGASAGSTLALLLQALPALAPYQRFRLRAGALDRRALDVFRVLRGIEGALAAFSGEALEEVVRGTLAREARLAWKARMERENPALLLEASELQAKVRALDEADREMRRANRDLLVHGVDRSRLGTRAQWEDITRLRGQRSRRLREFLEMGQPVGLMELRPVWLMNPDVASRVLPLTPGLFDTVIYDEASQMPVEFALPTLYRARTMVVSGDEKQMPPTAFFSSRVENDEADVPDEDDDEAMGEEARAGLAESWNRREIKDCPDLLQLARSVLPASTLQIHYRSAYRELIAYSNASFYAGQLSVPVRHPDAEVRRVRPVEVIRVDGIYENQTNRDEAEAVVQCLARLWAVPGTARPTVGVVTFNRRQADLIEEVLELRAEGDDAFRAALAVERERVEGSEDMGFFVKNVENVQGDERDVIVFSTTFGRNRQKTFRRHFGVLGQQGGERRLNVAVSRAKEKVILVTSIPVAEVSDLLSGRRVPHSPRDYLQAYLEYARTLSDGDLDAARALTARMGTGGRRERAADGAEQDGFPGAVAAFLEGEGWSPVAVADAGAFGMDLAIVDPRTGLYGIGIECDAPRHALLAHARAREIWRPAVLQRSIHRVHRVSSRGWYHEPARERERLRAAVREALSNGSGAG